MARAAPTDRIAPGTGARRERDPRRELGRCGEALAAAHLRRRGFDVLARNVRTRYGEIDLVAFDGSTLVFAEVKTRTADLRSGGEPVAPLAALGRRQRTRLRPLALRWLRAQRPGLPFAEAIRFDAIGIALDRNGALLALDHVENAW